MPTNPVEIILMVSTGFVAFVLLLSGAAKLRRPDKTFSSMVDLGVPDFLRRRWIAASVPIWEIALGLGLLMLSGFARSTVAILVLGTFGVFTFFVVGVLRRGASVDCGCFGSLSVDDRVTWSTAARNVALMLMAAAIAVTTPGHPSLMLQVAGASVQQLLAVALVWALVAVAVLLRATVRLRRPQPGNTTVTASDAPAAPTLGDPIPDAELVSPEGITVPLHALGHGSPVLLVFLSAECGKCAGVARRLPEWQQQIEPVLLRVATSSRPDVLRERVPEVLPFAYYGARSAKRSLAAEGLPAAVLLGGLEHPYVASGVARSEQEIDALVSGIVAARAGA